MEEIREETKAQKEIAAYISRNNISASEVARKTKVDVGLLTGKAERKMNASEMLSVYYFPLLSDYYEFSFCPFQYNCISPVKNSLEIYDAHL